MKIRHIIRLLTLSAVLSGGFTSCTIEEKDEDGNQQQIVIGIGPQTRSNPKDNEADINTEKFGFIAWHVKPSDTPVEHLNTYGKVKHVGGTAYGADLYSGTNPTTYYWPLVSNSTGHSLKFLAWYPYEGTGVPTAITPNASNQQLAMNFTVQNNVANQVDLMAATHMPDWNDNVELEFRHALTRIRFSFNKESSSADDYTVSAIKLKNVVKTASLTVAGNGTEGRTPGFTWNAGATPETQDISWSGSLTVSATGTNYNSMSDANTFMTIPMGAGASAVAIELTIDGQTVTQAITIGDFDAKTWNAGDYIDYKFTVSENNVVALSSNVIPWNEEPEQNVIFDGQYFLKVDKDDVMILPNGSEESFFVETDYTNIDPNQDFPDGLQIEQAEIVYSPSVTAGNEWVTLTDIGGTANGHTQREIKIAVTKSNPLTRLRTAKIKVKAGNMTKIVNVTQGVNITGGGLALYSYVGAFWRADQTGERLIRMANANPGTWRIWVYDYGEDFQPGDIVFSTRMSDDPNIGWRTDGNPNESLVADMNVPANDSRYFVEGNATTVTGTINIQGDYAFFRVGLKSKWTPTAAKPARYAVIAISYLNGTQHQKIWLRQGEDPDYLMRPGDPSGIGVGGRLLPARISPYNLTVPGFNGNGSQTQRVPIAARGGTWAEYPTQAGAQFQWAVTGGIVAINPAVPGVTIPTGWVDNFSTIDGTWDGIKALYESCPNGYRRPTDGPTNVKVDHTTLNGTNSEFGQSLFVNPPVSAGFGTDNHIQGSYADGYFDRREIKIQPEAGAYNVKAAVSINNSNVAYIGKLLYNPNNNASIFFPLCGHRRGNTGILEGTGVESDYWTSSVPIDTDVQSGSENALAFYFFGGVGRAVSLSRANGYSIRCVKDNPIP